MRVLCPLQCFRECSRETMNPDAIIIYRNTNYHIATKIQKYIYLLHLQYKIQKHFYYLVLFIFPRLDCIFIYYIHVTLRLTTTWWSWGHKDFNLFCRLFEEKEGVVLCQFPESL